MCGIGGVLSLNMQVDPAGLRRMGQRMTERGPDDEVWRLPDHLKLRWGERKYLLKCIAARLVPAEVIYRPKMGLAMPLSQWFKGELGLALERLMVNSVAEQAGLIDSKRVMRELKDHRSGKGNNDTRLWLILWLELWFRVVVIGELNYKADLSETLDICAS